MLRGDGRGRALRGWKRGFLVGLTVVGTLLALTGQASAQSPCGVSAVDQYVECIPTGDGRNSSGANQSGQGPSGPLSPSVAAELESTGGDDAEVLRQVATSPRYGAPSKPAASDPSSSTHGRISGEALAAADPDSDTSAGDAVSAAVSAVQGGDAARLVGLLVALFVISAVALALSAVRQKRRAAG
jgi:hypothetical protein